MSNKAILIVDDEAQIRDSFKMAFEQVGYSTYLAESGEEALDVLQTDNIHVMEAAKAGVSNYVIKPFTPDTFSEKLQKVLG